MYNCKLNNCRMEYKEARSAAKTKLYQSITTVHNCTIMTNQIFLQQLDYTLWCSFSIEKIYSLI